MNLQILAKIKFSRIFQNLQYYRKSAFCKGADQLGCLNSLIRTNVVPYIDSKISLVSKLVIPTSMNVLAEQTWLETPDRFTHES